MVLKHLSPFIASFSDELDKQAGIKEDLKQGTKKVLSALKSVPGHVDKATLRAAVKVHQLPGGDKVMKHGPGLLQKMVG